jgi:hypothetical protein
MFEKLFLIRIDTVEDKVLNLEFVEIPGNAKGLHTMH